MKINKALILSAGKGTRLYPLTKDIPKVMVEILGKPILEYHILLLKKYGINNIFINLFTMPEKIIDYFSNGEKFGVRIEYSREDTTASFRGPMLLGSAGALHNFKKKLKNDFFVLYGDVFSRLDLTQMAQHHYSKKSLFTMAVQPAEFPEQNDLVELDDKKKVATIHKRPHNLVNGWNNAGTYIINPKVIRYLPKDVPLDFAHDFIPLLLAKNIPIHAYRTEETMIDIGTIDRYNYLLKSLRNESKFVPLMDSRYKKD